MKSRVLRWMKSLAAFAVIATTCVSCRSGDYVYVVEITPTAKGLNRDLTVFHIKEGDSTKKHVPAPLEQAAADRLARIYGVRPDTLAIYVAHGKFSEIPDDIGNWGTMRRYDSTLGQAWNYTEQFHGDSNPMAGMQAAVSSGDSLVDIGVAWMESELGRHPKWPALRTYLDEDMRRALRNCALRAWRDGSSAWEQNAVVIMGQHPLLGLILGMTNDDDVESIVLRQQVIGDARHSIATILGLTSHQEIQTTLRFISDADTVTASVERYAMAAYGGTSEDATMRWQRIHAITLGGPFDIDESADTDSLDVRLAVHPGHVALDTNGTWDPKLQRVVWLARVEVPDGGGPGDPLYCYATWGVPDSVTQRRHFGKTLLNDESLIHYCMWFSTLEAAQKAEWNRMLKRLRPGSMKPLESFRFADEKGRESDAAALGRKLILDAVD